MSGRSRSDTLSTALPETRQTSKGILTLLFVEQPALGLGFACSQLKFVKRDLAIYNRTMSPSSYAYNLNVASY